MVLQIFLDLHEINLDLRIAEGTVLSLAEIEALVRLCGLPLDAIHNLPSVLVPTSEVKPQRVVSLEKHRKRAQPLAEVNPQTKSIRVFYIKDYLRWYVLDRALRMDTDAASFTRLVASGNVMSAALSARAIAVSAHTTIDVREGLDPAVVTRLLEVIELNACDNPWRGEHARIRNQLSILLLYYLGIRRGELLGLKISDINFRTNEILIARRADDPSDPRRHQPNAKTNDRVLAVDEALMECIRRYVLGKRRELAGARRHEFLLVANGSGAPLTLGALNKTFVALRTRCRGLTKDLSPHVLRHTWNDDFSDLMDRQKIPETKEHKMRAYQMGWSPTSQTAATYTKRHVRKKAAAASLALQKNLRQKST